MILDVQQKVKTGREQLDFIALALRGKKIGFEKVIKMVDDMVATLKTEQMDDNHKKEYCDEQFDLMDDKKKGLERSISDLETAIEDAKEGIAACVSDIKALEDGVKALDKSVAEATENRKEENEDFTELMAMDSAAKELIGFAKNRLNKFYNPKLYKAPPKRQITDAEQAELAAGGTLAPTEAPGGIAGTGVAVFAQVSLHVQHKDAPAPPPETFGAYEKKTESSTGVITMMDMIIAAMWSRSVFQSVMSRRFTEGVPIRKWSGNNEVRSSINPKKFILILWAFWDPRASWRLASSSNSTR
jgi:hypothetical protein